MKKILMLSLVIMLAGALRLYKLGNVPISPDWDEVSVGYNAYSLLKTGRDEFGNWLPLAIRSFDDFKPPLYTYLTIPSVAVFGLQVWSIRLPSALCGIVAVIGTYLLVSEMLMYIKLHNTNSSLSYLVYNWVPLISSLLLAISPWHIQFSRIAFEANVGITINIFAFYLFLKSIQDHRKLVLFAFLSGLSFYAYHTERLFMPLLTVCFLWIFRKKIFMQKNIRILLISMIIGVITISPLLFGISQNNPFSRLSGTTAFRKQTEMLERTTKKIDIDKKTNSIIGSVMNNRRLEWTKIIVGNYLSHFSLNWLFVTGDHPRHHAPDMGLLYLWELPCIVIGIVWLVKLGGVVPVVLFLWILISPLAASVTYEVPHAVRTLVFLPAYQIIASFGLVFIIDKIKGIRYGQNTRILCIVFILFNILYYLHAYFIHLNHEYAQYWQYGYKEAVAFTEQVKNRYEKIVVSTQLEQPYIFFLFYRTYDPRKYLEEGGSISHRFEKYEFRPILWNTEQVDGKTLYLATPKEIGKGNIVSIFYPNGESAIEIADKR